MIKYADLPTKEQCDIIAQNNDSFYRTEQQVDGVDVHIYNYRLASYSDFNNPLGDGSISAYWLRGLTFTKNKNDTWKRWCMLPKFFNVGETKGWMPEDFDGHEIESCQVKEDGSLISFVKINHNWLAKTKQKFDNDQAILSNTLKPTQVSSAFSRHSMYELCSPKNRIVVPYQNTELRKLCEVWDFGNEAFVVPEKQEHQWSSVKTVNDLLEQAKVVDGIEGWIIYCNGKIAKIKTDWYRRLHGLKFNLMRNDLQIFEATISDKLDDALWLIDTEMPELRAEIEQKAQVFRDEYHKRMAQLETLINGYYYCENRKDYALKFKDHDLFGLAASYLFSQNPIEKDVLLTEWMLKEYNKDNKVKELLK